MAQTNHELFDFLSSVCRELAEEYDRIQKRATEDSGNAGDEGEENWAAIMREWLPPTYQIVTRGRILGHRGIASPQVDVIVLKPTYPKYLLNKKLYLAGGVAAAFECKLTLKAKHIEEAVANCVEIKRLFEPRRGTPYSEFTSPIVYGLLAHSHSWKGEKSKPLDNIIPKFEKADKSLVQHPREVMDFICVADLVTVVAQRYSYFVVPDWAGDRQMKASASTGYNRYDQGESKDGDPHRNSYQTVGTFLCYLLRFMAWEDPSLRSLAEYFHRTGIVGNSTGSLRLWPHTVFTDEVRQKLLSMRQMSDFNIIDTLQWDEWAIIFT